MSKISIIMPVYNGEKFLREALNSVLEQTYTDWELLIINDNSNDSSDEIINKFMDQCDKIIYIKNVDNLGVATSRNIGIDKATGEFVAFIDCDDIWYVNKLEQQIEFVNMTYCDMTCTSYDLIDEKSNQIKQFLIDEKKIKRSKNRKKKQENKK